MHFHEHDELKAETRIEKKKPLNVTSSFKNVITVTVVFRKVQSDTSTAKLIRGIKV